MSVDPPLRLRAETPDDLPILSAALQDAVFRLGDLEHDRRARRLALAVNRFRWEVTSAGGRNLRARAVLGIETVQSLSQRGLADPRRFPDAVGQVLALRFEPHAEPPGGTLYLDLAGGGALRLEVECLDVVLVDLGQTWPARAALS